MDQTLFCPGIPCLFEDKRGRKVEYAGEEGWRSWGGVRANTKKLIFHVISKWTEFA